MKEHNEERFITFLLIGLVILSFALGTFIGSKLDNKDSVTTDDNIVDLTNDFARAEVRFMDGYVMTNRISGCVYHKDTGMFEVDMIQISGKSAVYYVAPENITLINMTQDINDKGE